MAVLNENLNIIHLDVSSNNISYQGANIIFNSLLNQHSIISLDLSSKEGINRNRLSQEGVILLEKVLKYNSLLEYLYISGNSIKNEGLKYILTGLAENKTLHTLHISNNEITSIGVNFFKTVLINTKIMDLDLSDNAIENEGCDIVAEVINDNQLGHMKRLNLSNCKINFDGFFRIFVSLETNKRLEHLNFSKNVLNNEKFNILKQNIINSNLKELILNKCKLGNKACYTIGEGICGNNSIKILNLSDNKIEDKGFKSFEELPIKNKNSLEVIDMSKNLISDLTAKNFAKNLETNLSLKVINFFDNQLRNESGTAFIESLRKNKNLLKIVLKYNRVQLRVLDEIKRLLKQNGENYKKKYVPNLKKEIKANFITEKDFETTNIKIQETGVNVRNLNEKLKEDIGKYDNLKKEEENRIIRIKNRNEILNKELVKYDELVKKIMNETVVIQNHAAKETEIINKEISHLLEKIRSLELTQRDLKNEQDKMRFQFEYELNKKTSELKSSEEKLNLAVLSSESLKKELENKKIVLDNLINPAAQGKQIITQMNITSLNITNNSSNIIKKSTTTNLITKKTESEINHNSEAISKENIEVDKLPKNNNTINKQRAKSANIRRNLKSAKQKIIPVNSETKEDKKSQEAELNKNEENKIKVLEKIKTKKNPFDQKKIFSSLNNKSGKENIIKKPNV